jgi:hypothetical protein
VRARADDAELFDRGIEELFDRLHMTASHWGIS